MDSFPLTTAWKLKSALPYQLNVKIVYICGGETFGLVPTYNIDIETFG